MSRRLFTLEEATALLPHLRVEQAAMLAERADLARWQARLAELQSLPKLNGHANEALVLEARIAERMRGLGARLDAITRLGIELKDLDNGLFDFPSLRDGRVVYLCWRVDEDEIGYWHDLDTGFRGRQPL